MSAERPILVVDDEDDVRSVILDLLTDERRSALGAENGAQAKALLEGGLLPSVVLLDLMMPVMDGWEFRRRQVQDPTIATVPVVVLSALDPTRAADLGGTAFLKRPLDFDRLLELVRRFCARVDC